MCLPIRYVLSLNFFCSMIVEDFYEAPKFQAFKNYIYIFFNLVGEQDIWRKIKVASVLNRAYLESFAL